VSGDDDEEQQQARPQEAPPPIPPDAEELKSSPRTDDFADLGASSASADTSVAFTRLIQIHAFMRFFCWLADLQYPAHLPKETRVSNHRQKSPCLYWVCVIIDFAVTGLALAGLVAIAFGIAYKSLMPLPPFWK
jgi:hypothetical protein